MGRGGGGTLLEVEERIERHLASLLERMESVPMPSLRLIQAPVFHGYTFSFWVDFEEDVRSADVEEALSGDPFDLRTSGVEAPSNVGMAGQSGIAVGAITPDRNSANAIWIWAAADNLRIAAESAALIVREACEVCGFRCSAVALAGCGYHVGGQTNLLPKELHTIAMPQFGNVTVQPKLAGYMSEAVAREFISRTKYAMVADPKQADATLTASIVNYVREHDGLGSGDGPRRGRADHAADSAAAGGEGREGAVHAAEFSVSGPLRDQRDPGPVYR